MSDRYTQIVNNPVGKFVAKNVGLPSPVELDRYEPGDPLIDGTVLVGAAHGGRLAPAIARVLAGAGAEVATELRDETRNAAADAGIDASVFNPETADAEVAFKALVFDATGIGSLEALAELHEFFSAALRRVRASGRVVVLAGPEDESVAQRALEGFTRSVAKEVRRGATANLVRVDAGAEDLVDSTLQFLLSPKSAYVSGQVVRIGQAAAHPVEWQRPLEGRVALVTGASRGIGAAIAEVLARDGAHVIGLDVPALEEDLIAVTDAIGGSAFPLDITTDGAPKAIARYVKDEHGGIDVVVHNAGITRDKTIGRMSPDLWQQVIDVNLGAPIRITDALMNGKGLIRAGGRVIGVSSISGIAGNAGQTNYATSKAGVIGFVQSIAPALAKRDATANAVAPGFIETAMTAKMPIALREGGRRMNSLSQGGLPVDVAETIAWFASPASSGVNGNVVRVCGQSMIGA